MATFYDDWLAASDRIQAEFQRSPIVAHDKDIHWVQTRQDAKVKLMISNETGFPTMGGSLLKAEIPTGWHTGKHTHGEECMHILEGQGFSIINGLRFDWHKGSTVFIPYRAIHQHFNTGNNPVQYLSAMCLPLEIFVRLARLEQLEDCGQNDPKMLECFPPEQSQYLGEGSRAVLHLEDAPVHQGDKTRTHYVIRPLVDQSNGFNAVSVKITHYFEEPPGYHGGRHRHLEALLYVLEGQGFSEIEGMKVPWTVGDALHIPPAMFEHQHHNPTDMTFKLLRISFGQREWFTSMWPEGYRNRSSYDETGRPIKWGKER